MALHVQIRCPSPAVISFWGSQACLGSIPCGTPCFDSNHANCPAGFRLRQQPWKLSFGEPALLWPSVAALYRCRVFALHFASPARTPPTHRSIDTLLSTVSSADGIQLARLFALWRLLVGFLDDGCRALPASCLTPNPSLRRTGQPSPQRCYVAREAPVDAMLSHSGRLGGKASRRCTTRHITFSISPRRRILLTAASRWPMRREE